MEAEGYNLQLNLCYLIEPVIYDRLLLTKIDCYTTLSYQF